MPRRPPSTGRGDRVDPSGGHPSEARTAVRLAPCDRDGTETGPPVPVTAALVPRREQPAHCRAMLHRYGWGARLYDVWWTRLRRMPTVLLRFRLDPAVWADGDLAG